jgi:hypothetical protein
MTARSVSTVCPPKSGRNAKHAFSVAPGNQTSALAIKQLYATHHFEMALDLPILRERYRTSGHGPHHYLALSDVAEAPVLNG